MDAEKVAALTPGFTGADLANLVNQAALLATRRGGDAVTMADFNNAVELIVAGLEKRNRLLNPKEREIVAYHEMGHALVALALPGVDVVHKVSIIPRGIGCSRDTIQRPTEDRFLMTRAELENKMAVLLGGRAAELLVFDHFSTGAADDLRRSLISRAAWSRATGCRRHSEASPMTASRELSLPDPIPSCRMASTTMARQPRMLSTPRFERSSTERWRGHLAFFGSAERSLSEPLNACLRRRLWTRLIC